MSIPFPSFEFFRSLQEGMNRNPACTEHLPPSEAYCGLAIGSHLFVLEFDGRTCSAIVPGGNELDLDFVVAGPEPVWKEAIEALATRSSGATLADRLESGALEIRSADDAGPVLAREALPFLEVFLGHARDLDIKFD